MPDKNYEVIFALAFAAARKATEDYLKKYPGQWYPCGFAWVHFKNGNSKDVRAFKKLHKDAGHKGYPSGWDVWNPSDNPTQWLDAKLAGCEAFVQVCASYGIECNADSRWD